MGLYHGVEHYEKLKINESSDVELFKSSWSKLLTDNFETRYDWSYIVAWVGVGMCLGSSILFSMSALCIKSDKEREEAMNMQCQTRSCNAGRHKPSRLRTRYDS